MFIVLPHCHFLTFHSIPVTAWKPGLFSFWTIYYRWLQYVHNDLNTASQQFLDVPSAFDRIQHISSPTHDLDHTLDPFIISSNSSAFKNTSELSSTDWSFRKGRSRLRVTPRLRTEIEKQMWGGGGGKSRGRSPLLLPLLHTPSFITVILSSSTSNSPKLSIKTASARAVTRTPEYNHITQIIERLHWLKTPSEST